MSAVQLKDWILAKILKSYVKEWLDYAVPHNSLTNFSEEPLSESQCIWGFFSHFNGDTSL